MSKIRSEDQSFPQLLILSNKIDNGDQTLKQECIPHIQHLMKMSNFCGLVGGVSGEGLYVIGFQNDKAIVLDPHYVQEVNKNTQ